MGSPWRWPMATAVQDQRVVFGWLVEQGLVKLS
jgi:hypothetical protein